MDQITTRHLYRTRLFLYTFIVVILGAALAGAGVFTLLPVGLGSEYGAVISTIEGIENMLMRKVIMLYAVIAAGIVTAMGVLHLFYSHRIAGPAYRLSLEAGKIAQGNLGGNIKFRQKDNLTDMADSLNEVAEQYRTRIASVKNHFSAIDAETEGLILLIEQGKTEPYLETAVEEITGTIAKMDKIFAEMRT